MRLSRLEALALCVLLAIFTWFTWRGLTMFFSGDDMMNMYGAWNLSPWVIFKSQLLLWMPVYRPVGTAVYRIFYEAFGFHPAPLYTFCWLLLLTNVVLAYYFLREVTANVAASLIALALVAVHGSFGDLYYSAGTIYDRLCFFFTVTGLIAYFHYRRRPSWIGFVGLCLFCVLAMGSKESGVVLPVLMFSCECLFFLPRVWEARAFRTWLRTVGPLFSVLAVLCLIFVFGRVNHTPELAQNAGYRPHLGLGVWLSHLGVYFSLLVFRDAPMSSGAAGTLLAAMLAVAILARNRAMLFGWIFFVLSITPVALIKPRFGYVLYLPILGLGLYFGAALGWLLSQMKRAAPYAQAAMFVMVTGAVVWANARNWPTIFLTQISPEFRLTEQFRRTYPKLPPKTKMLFVSDDFPQDTWDLMFNIRLLYHDKSILVNRLVAMPDQQPDKRFPVTYDYLLAHEGGRYVELDPRTPDESIRLNTLRNYRVGQEMDMGREDHSAYVVSGLKDGGGTDASRWTAPKAKFKFVVRNAPAEFKAKMYVPEFVAKGGNRTLSVVVNGTEIGTIPLKEDGIREVRFPVPAGLVRSDGYTFVEMNVANPYKDAGGVEWGVVLMRAAFEPGNTAS